MRPDFERSTFGCHLAAESCLKVPHFGITILAMLFLINILQDSPHAGVFNSPLDHSVHPVKTGPMATGTLTIDLSALQSNWKALDALSATQTAAVVKADGYGLGSGRVAKALAAAGARQFFVAVAEEAEAQGVPIKGENALAGGATTDTGWDNIENAFDYASYSGMTVLRINQVATGGTGQYRYEQFINNYLQVEESGDFQRTVIFMYGPTDAGQDMFIRGGIDHNYANTNLGRNCQTWNTECAIRIQHNNLLNSTTASWKSGDLYLDWYGLEANQGAGAEGTAMDWTTNNWPSSWGPLRTVPVDGYGESALNSYGYHYWMLDVQMDCANTVNGWFELKSYISNGPGWEGNINQSGTPYNSGNHMAQCGKINVFERNSNTAQFVNF